MPDATMMPDCRYFAALRQAHAGRYFDAVVFALLMPDESAGRLAPNIRCSRRPLPAPPVYYATAIAFAADAHFQTLSHRCVEAD